MAEAAKKVPEPKEEGTSLNPFSFVRGTHEELKKVTWPTKQELINHTVVVLIAVVMSAALIWIIDTFFSGLFRLILG